LAQSFKSLSADERGKKDETEREKQKKERERKRGRKEREMLYR
jgi:hypothetical protein